jgi:hypothetical protein
VKRDRRDRHRRSTRLSGSADRSATSGLDACGQCSSEGPRRAESRGRRWC